MSKIMHCKACQTFGTPKTVIPGSRGIAAFFALFFPFNFIYSAWRKARKYKACRNCGGRDLVPENEVSEQDLERIIGGKSYVENKLRNDHDW